MANMTNEEKLQRLQEELDHVLETVTALSRAAYAAAGYSPETVEILTADRRAEAETECAKAMREARLNLYGASSSANH